jgi:hypothetical protein
VCTKNKKAEHCKGKINIKLDSVQLDPTQTKIIKETDTYTCLLKENKKCTEVKNSRKLKIKKL